MQVSNLPTTVMHMKTINQVFFLIPPLGGAKVRKVLLIPLLASCLQPPNAYEGAAALARRGQLLSADNVYVQVLAQLCTMHVCKLCVQCYVYI